MAHIPKDARWYLADVVLEHTVEGDPRNVVHVNVHLVEADSPERAFARASALGREAEQVYKNTADREVRVTFRGLRELNVIHDALEDGAELMYEESIQVPEDELTTWLRRKDELAVFRKREACLKRDAPNYMPESVMKSLEDAGFTRGDIED
jgi:Domain of unknown function (DUF4288)